MRNEFPLSLHFFCSFSSKEGWTDSQRKTLPDYHVSSSCVVVRDGRACHFSTLEVKGGDLRTRRRILPIREGAASHLLRSSFNQLPIQLPRLVTVNRFTFRLHAIEQLLTLLPAGTGAKLTRDKAKLCIENVSCLETPYGIITPVQLTFLYIRLHMREQTFGLGNQPHYTQTKQRIKHVQSLLAIEILHQVGHDWKFRIRVATLISMV